MFVLLYSSKRKAVWLLGTGSQRKDFMWIHIVINLWKTYYKTVKELIKLKVIKWVGKIVNQNHCKNCGKRLNYKEREKYAFKDWWQKKISCL